MALAPHHFSEIEIFTQLSQLPYAFPENTSYNVPIKNKGSCFRSEVAFMEDTKQELCNLIDRFTDYQVQYLLDLLTLVNKLSEYQARYLLAFIRKRFNL